MAAPRFRAAALLQARRLAGLTQSELAARAVQEEDRGAGGLSGTERARRVRTWQGRIGAWERGVDSPSASYVPTLARLVGVEPLVLFDVDPAAPSFTALRLSAGLTLQALAAVTGMSYTSLYRMSRGVAPVPAEAGVRLAAALGVSGRELAEAIARDR
jgi:transcriptional regulator with XRE-family HTH domain